MQNFVSVGNEFLEIQLDRHKSTLVTGKNGAGKSSVILDSITYALYGKAYRNINKPQLINSMTKKNLLVEIEFSIGKKEYLVRRGENPSLFEVYQNGNLLKQDAAIRDYQKNFEKNILKISEKSFRQIIILGSANYKPFMQLYPADRRQIIEDLLDIQIFTTMNVIAKEKNSVIRSQVSDCQIQIDILKEKLELTKKHINTLKVNNEDLIRVQNEKKSIAQNEIDSLLIAIEELNSLSVLENDKIQNYDQLKLKKTKLNEFNLTYKQRLDKIKKEIHFFQHNENCPTCKQEIDTKFREETVNKRTVKQEEIDEASRKINETLQEINSEINQIEEIISKINQYNQKIMTYNQSISHFRRNIKDYESEIARINDTSLNTDKEQSELNTILDDMKKVSKTKEKLLRDQQTLDICLALLKDTGIKTAIIKQYVPLINKIINKNLAIMEFFCDFELDESFNEVIRSRGRDDFSYNSFSEGEKARIDLAILLAWREISRIRSSISTNLLILDEIFDSSMDSIGSTGLLTILDSLDKNNIFVISHKQDLFDKFHSCVEFEKVKGFTRIAERVTHDE